MNAIIYVPLLCWWSFWGVIQLEVFGSFDLALVILTACFISNQNELMELAMLVVFLVCYSA